MSKPTSTNVLADPEIRRHTQRILALQKEERQTREQLGRIVAEIGAELIAAKAALDRLANKTAWLRWLKEHVHYSVTTAENYMRVARFARKFASACEFFVLDPTVLYRVASFPAGDRTLARHRVEMACLGDARHQEETRALRA